MARERYQVYKCELCGKIIEILHGGGPVPVCCNQDMILQAENTVDAAQEKHVPMIEKVEGGYKVMVGEVAHPMGEDHWIEWIEIIADGYTLRKYLDPGDQPEAVFQTGAQSVTARAYCNLHGFWKAE
jgi:superoxide reductase